MQQCFSQAKSKQQFLELLQEKELPHYERNGIPPGVDCDGTNLRFSRIFAPGQFENQPNETRVEDLVMAAIKAVRPRQQERDSRELDISDREFS